nr:hypothetical protein [Mesorhizobium sp. L2C054A000]
MRACSLLLSTGLILTGAVSVAFAEDSEIITAPDPAVIFELAKGYGSAKMDKDTGRSDGLGPASGHEICHLLLWLRKP